MRGLLLCLCALLPAGVWSKDYFTAAVFEHRPRTTDMFREHPAEIKSANLHYYKKATAQAAQEGADIILFNEYGVMPYLDSREETRKFGEEVPDPTKHKFNPCTEEAIDRQMLYTVSCLARKHHIYIMANLIDIHKCQEFCEADGVEGCQADCPEDGIFLYNTDVAFDREGNIIARYHKCHPYFEKVNVPQEQEFITFDTDFGKFGMIVCFDSVFTQTSRLAKEHGIDTLLFPTFWFDDVVPFNAIEWQQSHALANNINFMAANVQMPGYGSLGSGIYSRDKGALAYTYEPTGESKLLLANLALKDSPPPPDNSKVYIIKYDKVIPIKETGKKFPENGYVPVVGKSSDLFKEYRYFKSQTVNHTLVKLETSSGNLEACYGDFCCHLSYSADNLQDDYYLTAFNGLNHVYNGMDDLTYYGWYEQVCLLVRCNPVEGKPCVVQPPSAKSVFQNVELKAQFSEGVLHPTVSYERFRLAPKSEYTITKSGTETALQFTSESKKPLLKVGLLGRIFEKDPSFDSYYKY